MHSGLLPSPLNSRGTFEVTSQRSVGIKENPKYIHWIFRYLRFESSLDLDTIQLQDTHLTSHYELKGLLYLYALVCPLP